jgi:hypothetical protein
VLPAPELYGSQLAQRAPPKQSPNPLETNVFVLLLTVRFVGCALPPNAPIPRCGHTAVLSLGMKVFTEI